MNPTAAIGLAKRRPSDYVTVTLCVAAILFVVCGGFIPIRWPVLDVAALKPLDVQEPAIQGSGFAPDAVFPSTAPPPYRGSVHFYGSWIGSARSVGSVHTCWYPAVPRFAIFFSGYLNQPGNRLFVEVLTASHAHVDLPIPPELIPGEAWWVKEIALTNVTAPLKFRIVAEDGSTTEQGWLGFSDPFVIQSVDAAQIAKQILFVVLTTAACIVAFFTPGLLIRQKVRNLAFVWIPLPGIAVLAIIGLSAWLGPAFLRPRWISRFGLAVLVVFATYRFIRTPLSRVTTHLERRALLFSFVLACLAIAKSSYSLGPSGELYAGRISRTLEVGGRADSRISFHGVQLIAYRMKPHSAAAASFYYPWDFSSRGPLAGLAVAPIVLSSPVQVTPKFPDAPWQLFDPNGFAAYRIGMIVLACCGLLTVFGLARLFVPEAWALLAFLVTITSPFVVHEVYFTWPKLLAASFVLLAAYLVFQFRYLAAGVVLGIGYLVHPSALLWVPALAGCAFLQVKPRKLTSWLAQTARILLGLAMWLLFWAWMNRAQNAQDVFLSYFAMAAGRPLTTVNWLWSRYNSILNTLVPLHLFFFDSSSQETRSIYGPSPPLIRFFFQYWNTLPFGVGIAFFCSHVIRTTALGFRKARGWMVFVFLIPFLFFAVYWGMTSGGLLREGLHAWVLGLLIACVVCWHRLPPRSAFLWKLLNYALLSRGVEIVLMLLLPVIGSSRMLVQKQFQFTDIFSLVIMLGSAGVLCISVFLFAEKQRAQECLPGSQTEKYRTVS